MSLSDATLVMREAILDVARTGRSPYSAGICLHRLGRADSLVVAADTVCQTLDNGKALALFQA